MRIRLIKLFGNACHWQITFNKNRLSNNSRETTFNSNDSYIFDCKTFEKKWIKKNEMKKKTINKIVNKLTFLKYLMLVYQLLLTWNDLLARLKITRELANRIDELQFLEFYWWYPIVEWLWHLHSPEVQLFANRLSHRIAPHRLEFSTIEAKLVQCNNNKTKKYRFFRTFKQPVEIRSAITNVFISNSYETFSKIEFARNKKKN